MSDAFERLARTRVVPVLTASDPDEAERACQALLEGGLSAVEITFRTETAADAIRRIARIDGLLVGAGTVVSPEQLGAAVDAGARFAVAPGTNPAVVDAARRANLPFAPGVATPTEVERARGLGCLVVKIFPASLVGGPPFLAALAAVYPEIRFVPTGGINRENLASYLELPAVLACGGTWICEPALLRERRFDEIERRAREAVGQAALAGPV
ncbi:MAG TPA: bifunctional 4-hydroxy-2-oxoglutarate aldolase/2-dehydro-3-deoxy-phosphogluconate aldolase [Gaiellaceae bacterium]